MTIDTIKTITVLGAGDMGHGIAEVALMAGYRVYLRDINSAAVEKGVKRIIESLEKLVSKGKVAADLFDKIKKELLIPITDLKKAVQNTDLIIEAIPEIMELKKETFSIVDEAAPSHAIIASNTSTMSISEFADGTKRPDRFAGLHYFNPAVLMPLVEVIRGSKTSEATFQTCYDFVLKNKKVPVRVNKDVAGFIVNRVQAPGGVLLNCILDQKIANPEEVDALMRNQGLPMGPYEIFDFTGIDINVHVFSYYAKAIHPDYAIGKTMKGLYDQGKLGKKTGSGIFDWSKGRPAIDLTKTTQAFDPMDLLAVNANEAARIVAMGVCSFEDVDTAIKNATGNPKGLISQIKHIPAKDMTERLENLSKTFGKEIFKPSRLIREGAYCS
ncbi:MAG: 3-hydroxyacyl-CoA dehydrogenase family protein [Proteobacteria bacterium]|nr:3-hydroxyacyl-CoA dehydrogenase family protein [Pseudomonadota bacterium]